MQAFILMAGKNKKGGNTDTNIDKNGFLII